MKPWAEHAADLYLLALDILQNHYLQQHSNKNRFYYSFNPALKFLQTDSGDDSQLKLLEQLQAKGALDFEDKQPTGKTPSNVLSRNTQRYSSKTVLLIIKPYGLNSVFKEFRRYGKPVAVKQKKAFNGALLEGSHLYIRGFTISFKRGNQKNMLQLILQDKDSRRTSWSHKELMDYLEPSSKVRDYDNFVRNTANNINSRVAQATDNAIPKLLHVTTVSVQLDPDLV